MLEQMKKLMGASLQLRMQHKSEASNQQATSYSSMRQATSKLNACVGVVVWWQARESSALPHLWECEPESPSGYGILPLEEPIQLSANDRVRLSIQTSHPYGLILRALRTPIIPLSSIPLSLPLPLPLFLSSLLSKRPCPALDLVLI